MEIYPQTFFNNLNECLRDQKNGPDESEQLLNILNRNLSEEQFDKNDLDIYLIHIFHQSHGLVNFIYNSLGNNSYKNTQVKALEVLHIVVENFHSDLSNENVLCVYSLSAKIIKSDSHAMVKDRLFKLLVSCLEKLDRYVESNESLMICKDVLNSLKIAVNQKHSETVKGKELLALGHFVKKFSYLIDETTMKEIKALFWRTFQMEGVKSKISQPVLCGFFTGFMHFCEIYNLQREMEEDYKIIQKLYSKIKDLAILPNEKIKVANRAAITFFGSNLNNFKDLMLVDYEFWHKSIMEWLKAGAEETKVGYAFLNSYFHMLGTMLENDKNEHKNLINYFNKWSQTTLNNRNAKSYELRIAVICFKLLSAAFIKNLDKEHRNDLFLSVKRTFEQIYILKYDPEDELWEFLPHYIQAFASFTSLEDFSPGDFICIQRGVINMIQSYPQFQYAHRYAVIDGMTMAVFYLKKTKYFDVFIENVIYQGVIWSCSHQHISASEFSTEESSKKILTVRSYLPFWKGIFDITFNRTYDKYGFHLEDRKYILERLISELIKTLAELIDKLNLSVKYKEEEEATTDLEQAFKVEKRSDYSIFLNMVDFYREIFNHVNPKLFKNHISRNIIDMINKCIQNPLVSGFYKLLSHVLKIARKLEWFGNENNRNEDVFNCREKLNIFLPILLNSMDGYKDELLTSCLQVLLEVPIDIIKEILPSCEAPFMNIFTIGKSYLPLAEMGIDTLERWQESIESDSMDNLLKKVLPHLDTFLRSKSLKGQGNMPVEKRRKTAQPLKKRRVLVELEPELIKIQRRILSFIGKQGLKNCHAFIFSDDLFISDAVLGHHHHLKITLPYDDMHCDIHLDTFLPKIIDLALHASDRKIRATACELLQAAVMVLLGSAKPMSATGILELNDLLKLIANPILQLGCDADPLIKQIFEPLFLQLIHWYTSPTQIRSPHAAIIIDTLTDGITHVTNSSLRDFSGECIKEFIKWTIKQTNEVDLGRYPIYIKVFVKKMKYFSTHPDSAKKLGCALIFNNIYRELREEDALVDIFWIEILHIFVNSLASFENIIDFNESKTVEQTKNSLKHVQRVFIKKASIFRVANSKRRVPPDLNEGLLKDVAVWLLRQTATRSKYCRECCMELFLHITPLTSGTQLKLQTFVQQNYPESLLSLYEKQLLAYPKDLSSNVEDYSKLFLWFKSFLCALDGLNFILKNNIEDVNFNQSEIFTQLYLFLTELQDIDFIGALNLMVKKSWNFTLVDQELFFHLKSACILVILKIYNLIIQDTILVGKAGSGVFRSGFWRLIINIIFQPHLLNINPISKITFEEILSILLRSLPNKLPETYMRVFMQFLVSYLNDYSIAFEDFNTGICCKQRNFSNGLLLLNNLEFNEDYTVALNNFSTGLLNQVMEIFCQNRNDNKILINSLKQTTHEYVSNILKFSLKNKNELTDLLNHLFGPYIVHSIAYGEEVTFGIYILKTFPDTIIPYIVNDFNMFLEFALKNNDIEKTVQYVLFILKYVSKEKKFKSKYLDLSSNLMHYWNIFEEYFNLNYDNTRRGIQYVRLLFELNVFNQNEILKWLINCLCQKNEVNDFEIFELMVFAASEELANASNDLENSLFIFADKNFGGDSDKNSCMLNKIISLLPYVRCSRIALFIIRNYLDIPTNFNIGDYLANFLRNVDENIQFKVLTSTHEILYDKSKDFHKRYKLAKEVLPWILRNSKRNIFHTFFIANMDILRENLNDKNEFEINIFVFIYIEILFELSEPEEIESVCKEVNISENCHSFLTPALNAFKNQKEDEICRIYRCHAYNAMATMIANFPKFNKLYIKLFTRQVDNKDILWNGLVDTTKKYSFPLFFESVPKQRKILLGIRDELKQSKNQEQSQKDSLKYIASQRIVSSSLSEDFTNFDFTNSMVRTEKHDYDDTEKCNFQRAVYIESTEVNNHECMGTLCGFIQHIFDSGLTQIPTVDDDDEIELPDWMQGLRTVLLNPKTHANVKIFLVKVIDNMIDIFTPYSRWFIECLLQFIVDKCAGDTINYFVADVLIMLSRWAHLKSELSEKECKLASDMLYFFIKNLNTDRVDVFKYNLDVIKLMVEAWKSFIKVPNRLIYEYIASDVKCAVGIHLTSIFLVNKMEVWNENESKKFLQLLMKKLYVKSNDTVKICSETIGLFLKYFDDPEYTSEVDTCVKKVPSDKYILCIEGIAIHYPRFVSTYHITKIISALNQCNGNEKVVRLKIIGKRLEYSSDVIEEIGDFQIVEWCRLIENPDLDIQINTLDIIKKGLKSFMNFKMFPDLIQCLLKNVQHPNDIFRSYLYDITFLVYEQNSSYRESVKRILIMGLSDASEANKNKVMYMWNNKMNIPDYITQRFSYILSELYDSSIEDHFLGWANYFFIGLLNASDKIDDLLFEHPLEDCDFEDYKLQTNWRLQPPSVVPLFAETLQTYDQDITQDFKNEFQLRQTQDSLDFSVTQDTIDPNLKTFINLNSTLRVDSTDVAFKNPNTVNLSQKYRERRRFLADKKKISKEFANIEIKKKVLKTHKRIESAKEREKKVTIYRNYRKGDFPDIQITLSAVLKPLQMLALQDGEVSNILFQEIFKGIVSKVVDNENFLDRISNSIKHIFNTSVNFNPYLIGAVLDILLKNTNKIRIEPELIAYVCQESGLISIGTLLLEEYILSLDEQPSGSKRGTGCVESSEISHWVQLAVLYKQLEEWDIVQAIFLEKMNCKETIQVAIKYESESFWKCAQELYEELLKSDLSFDRKDFYYESYFRCFANLGEWQHIPNVINTVVEDGKSTWEGLWDGGWSQQKLLPWYITAQVKNGILKHWSEDFLQNINICLSDDIKRNYLISNFSEELCMISLGQKDISLATGYLKSYNKHFLEEWQLIKPMFQSQRYQKLLKLQAFIETNEFIAVYNNSLDEFEISLPKLIKKWETLSKELLPSMMLNETRHIYRSQFINILMDKLSKLDDVDYKNYKKNLKLCEIKMDLNLINIAAEGNNYYLAKKYYKTYKDRESTKLRVAYGNIALAKSKMNLEVEAELDADIEAQVVFSSLLEISDQKIVLNANSKLYDIYLRLQEILTDQKLFDEYQKKIKDRMGFQINSPEDIGMYGYNNLKNCVKIFNEEMDCDKFDNGYTIAEIAKAYVKLAHFIRSKNDENLQGEFITFVLRAMKMNSLEGIQLFPCVLMQIKLGNEYKKIFIHEAERIPIWMFLGWVPQLLAYLNSNRISAISGIILRIAEMYPQAIMFPYRLSRETYGNSDNVMISREMEILTDRLDRLLLSNELVDKFLKALSYVCVPTAILRYYVEKMIKCQNLEEIKNIHKYVMDNVLNGQCNSRNLSNMQGDTYKKVEKYKSDFKNFGGMEISKMKDNLKKLNATLKQVLENRKETYSLRLLDYCPWLADFSGNRMNSDIEIPGQYDGKKMPLPQHHVKISGFHTNVLVLKSMRKPIKITILGMDTKEYPFLVKFGEDIRQDQRIEQLFSLMNDIYRSDTTCSNNGLQIITYQVFPLTTNLGIIQWIDQTKTLNLFLENSWKDEKINEKICNSFYNWLPKMPSVQAHGHCAMKYKREKVIPFFNSLINRIPLDTLRKSFELLSTNTENFIALRNNFIKTYSVLCISQWILGIGDRHLENSLISIKNGQVLGIDFGHAFGTATQILPIPELVPIRLTPHLISLMEPLRERGQFRAYMIHCLKAMRKNSNSLLATMNVFIEEPSLDWLEHASRFEDVNRSNLETWFPKIKVEQSKRKLKGANSAAILIEDLVAGRNPYAAAYIKLVKGDKEIDKRAVFENDNLSVENQIECLLDHATDYNLLGRMYGGWKSWV